MNSAMRSFAVTIIALLCGIGGAQSSTLIECIVPVIDPGTVDVTVTNPDLSTGTLANGFTLGFSAGTATPAPSGHPQVTQIIPAYGPPGTKVTIIGTGFDQGGTTIVKFGGVAATGVMVAPGPGPDDYYGGSPPPASAASGSTAKSSSVGGAHIVGSRSLVEDGHWVQLSLVTDVLCEGCEVQWEVEQGEKSAKQIENGLSISGANRPVLTIDPATISDSGRYVVAYNDGSGWQRTAPFSLRVVKADSLPLEWWPVALVLGIMAFGMLRRKPGRT